MANKTVSSTVHGLRSPANPYLAGPGKIPKIAPNTNIPGSAPKGAAPMRSPTRPKNPAKSA